MAKKRLIDANVLLAEIVKVQALEPDQAVAKIIMLVTRAESVDAAPVVRCRDCEHWHEETGWCDKHSHFVDRLGDFCYPEESGDWKMFDADYFCKDGERRTDNA